MNETNRKDSGPLAPLKLPNAADRYRAMIGVGGIGSGMFFALNGNHTLGREESRGGHFLDRRDYCKLHIISHYVQTLLGPDFITLPIGRVGDDEIGRRLLAEMAGAGLAMRHVKSSPGDQTLFSFCFIYPDGSGGNMTTDDSACARVDAALVAEAEPDFARFAGHGLALAAPEVPLAARDRLLQLGTTYRFFRVASFLAGEIRAAMDMGMLARTDLLAINLDEAVAAGMALDSSRTLAAPEIVEAALAQLQPLNPALLVSVTAGRQGSWTWDGQSLVHQPAFATEVVSTAGAGDAHLAGIMAGLVAGLTLPQAQQLGTLVAGLSVTSPHTIHPGLDRRSLQAFATLVGAALKEPVRKLLFD